MYCTYEFNSRCSGRGLKLQGSTVHLLLVLRTGGSLSIVLSDHEDFNTGVKYCLSTVQFKRKQQPYQIQFSLFDKCKGCCDGCFSLGVD